MSKLRSKDPSSPSEQLNGYAANGHAAAPSSPTGMPQPLSPLPPLASLPSPCDADAVGDWDVQWVHPDDLRSDSKDRWKRPPALLTKELGNLSQNGVPAQAEHRLRLQDENLLLSLEHTLSGHLQSIESKLDKFLQQQLALQEASPGRRSPKRLATPDCNVNVKDIRSEPSTPNGITNGSSQAKSTKKDSAEIEHKSEGRQSIGGYSSVTSPKDSIASFKEKFRSALKTSPSSLSMGSHHSACPAIKEKFRRDGECSQTLWTFLEEPKSSLVASWYAVYVQVVTILAVVIPLMQSQVDPPLSRSTSAVLENCFDVVFMLEVLVRLAVAPYKRTFFWSGYNLIDFFAFVTFGARTTLLVNDVTYDDYMATFFYCLVPMVRVLKTLRTNRNLRLLSHAFRTASEALPLPLFILFILTLVFGTVIFIAEPREEIESMPKAMYFVIISITTIGYGDISPTTEVGRFVCSIMAVTGVLFMAMPLNIVGNAFSETWARRDYYVLVSRLRDRVLQYNYNEEDAQAIFQWYDWNHDGEISATEFNQMMLDMRIGMDSEEILRLFRALDEDGSDLLSEDEFIGMIFPTDTNFLSQVSASMARSTS